MQSPSTTSRYFTTPIFYVNSDPHLGHAYTAILGDVLTRFYRQRGRRSYLLTGTDEHGEKIEQSAAKNGLDPQSFTDKVSERFRTLWPQLSVIPDDFIRTTEPRHKVIVQQVLQQLFDAGEIYKGEYRGLYCTGCERFLTDKDLVNGNCPDHGIPPHEVVEENYLFRMEKHREWLRETLEHNPSLIEPERYRNEVLAILREPIGDLSISRPTSRLSWGIPMPFDGNHVAYVWFDALFNYVSALGGPGAELYEALWPSTTHLLAKDIVKQHGIFWPIMLKAAGLPLFQGLRVHGYWLADATKMSKSLGNVVRPLALTAKYGVDGLRYFLSRDMVFGSDSDFSEVALAARYNSDLANDLGNLLSRVMTMLQRYCGGVLPASDESTGLEQGLLAVVKDIDLRVDALVDEMQLNVAIEEILQCVRKANQYVHEAAPWAAAKDPALQGRVNTILHHAAEVLRIAAVLLFPFMPTKMNELMAQLGIAGSETGAGPGWQRGWGGLPVGQAIAPGAILFPKIDLEALKAELQPASEVPAKPAKPTKKPAGQTHEKAVDANKTPGAVSSGGAASSSEPSTTTAPTASRDKNMHDETAPEAISIDDFAKVQLKVARVLHAEPVPRAKKLLKLSLEVGSETRQVVSGIADHYTPESLIGKTVVMVFNLKPATLRGVESQGMILAAEDAEGQLSLVTLDRQQPSGGTVR